MISLIRIELKIRTFGTLDSNSVGEVPVYGHELAELPHATHLGFIRKVFR